MAQLSFNSNNVEPQASFDPIPKAWYMFTIEKCELKPTKAGTGSYLSLQLKVNEGEFANRVVFDMITYENPNPQAVEIGHRKLSALCRAVGIVELTGTDLLENRVVAGKVGIVVDKTGEYDPKNDIKEYKSATAATTQVGSTQQTTTTQTQTVAGNTTAQQPAAEENADAPWEQ